MRVLGLIPARGGSKGIQRKNVRALGGRPLLAYTAEAALSARTLSRVVLSTEDEEIADLGRALGLDVPFLRPAALADDEAPMLSVVQHVLSALEGAGDRYDAVCLLQPTNPLRTAETIDACVQLLERSGADAAVTVLPIPTEHNPHWAFEVGADGFLRLTTGEAQPITRRQDLPPAFHREGSVYVTRVPVVLAGSLYGGRLVGLEVRPDQSVNLDEPGDWARAETLLAAGARAPAGS
ncbi:MAG: cytidylyltransferase domain-containing protein [Acidimicrobiia bacterium]